MADFKIQKVEAVLGEGCFYEIEDQNTNAVKFAVSKSFAVQAALLAAVVSHSIVSLEFVGTSPLIHRVFFFGDTPSLPIPIRNVGAYYVHRLATQRNGQDEHMEVIVTDVAKNEEVPFNLFDPFLQAVIATAFHRKVDLGFKGNDVTNVSLRGWEK